jgi:hypothetical protein
MRSSMSSETGRRAWGSGWGWRASVGGLAVRDGACPGRLMGNNLVISRGAEPAAVTADMPMNCPVEKAPGCVRADLRISGAGERLGAAPVQPPTSCAAAVGRCSHPCLPANPVLVTTSRSSRSRGMTPSQAPYGFVDFELGSKSSPALLAPPAASCSPRAGDRGYLGRTPDRRESEDAAADPGCWSSPLSTSGSLT